MVLPTTHRANFTRIAKMLSRKILLFSTLAFIATWLKDLNWLNATQSFEHLVTSVHIIMTQTESAFEHNTIQCVFTKAFTETEYFFSNNNKDEHSKQAVYNLLLFGSSNNTPGISVHKLCNWNSQFHTRYINSTFRMTHQVASLFWFHHCSAVSW